MLKIGVRRIIVVSDWARDPLYSQEFATAVAGNLRVDEDPHIRFVSSTSSSVHTAFLLSQVTRIERRLGRPQHTLLFQGTEAFQEQMARPKFLIARLHSEMVVIGYGGGYSFSMIKKDTNELFSYTVESTQTRFHARDTHARVVAHFLEGLEHELDLEEEHRASVPELVGHYVVHIDSFGNVVTNLTGEDLKGIYSHEEKVSVRVGLKALQVRYLSDPLLGTIDELILAPGSSGSLKNPYLEFFVKGASIKDSAYHRFGKPDTSTNVTLL